MAITRLTDIITVFESKWTYGDVKFGYESEINQDHDAKYPLMLVEPPSSIIPAIYDGREEYEFEINFYNLYSQAAQSVVTLQKRWDNLQDLANEWLDFVLKNYQDDTVQAYLNDESVEFERVKEVGNDRLVQIKMTFTMSAFTKCFRPVSHYPSDFGGTRFELWLRADSNVTFDIPTKRVSAWNDGSGQGNNTVQTGLTAQPLRYGFDGINDKSYIEFDGTNDLVQTVSNSPISSTDFTIFEVSTIKNNHSADGGAAVLGYRRGLTATQFVITTNPSNQYAVSVVDNSGDDLYVNTSVSTKDTPHIAAITKSSQTLTLKYYDASTGSSGSTHTNTDTNFNTATSWGDDKLTVGQFTNASGQFNLKGNVHEIIAYAKVLTDAEIQEIVNYLNTKYKIY